MIKRLLSYFTPIVEKKYPSKVSQRLEVVWTDGELVVDTKQTNYSYGNLEKTLRKGLSYIGFSKIQKMDNVLILGLGAGSVLKTLIEEVKYKNSIHSVELDEAMIFIGKRHFNLSHYDKQHTLHLIDAFEFMLRTSEKFDLIIIDLFQDVNMPPFLFEEYFTKEVQKALNPGGFILFNTIVLNEEDRLRNDSIYTLYSEKEYSIRTYPKLHEYNELFTIKKLK